VLDLAGKGIKITPLSSSNNFYTIASDSYEHRTAWAAAGNAVLFFDPSNSNKITQQNQIVFTDWDPGATTDMQALLDVFDTDHDGSLDAGDTGFSSFKLMVTNADGTTSVETLAQAGIASINLTADQTQQSLPDGSSIDGEALNADGSLANETISTTSANGLSKTITFDWNGDGVVDQVQSDEETSGLMEAWIIGNPQRIGCKQTLPTCY